MPVGFGKAQGSALPHRRAALKVEATQTQTHRAGGVIFCGRPWPDRGSCRECHGKPGSLHRLPPAGGWASEMGAPGVNVPHLWPPSTEELGGRISRVVLRAALMLLCPAAEAKGAS